MPLPKAIWRDYHCVVDNGLPPADAGGPETAEASAMTDNNESVRALIDRLLRERGITFAEASRRMGKNETYLFGFIRRGKPRKLAEDARIALAQMLELPDDKVLKTGGGPPTPLPPSNVRPASGSTSYGQRDLPIRGRAQGGPDGVIHLGDGTIDWTWRSPELASVRDAYALYVDGDSMSDFNLPHGSIVFVHPHRRPQPGRICVLVLNSGAAYVKRLDRVTQSKVVVSQSNPPRSLEFPAAEVSDLHMVTSAVFA
jgi:phage repressor protein C with HTH and peptisase S24 domain